MAPPAVRVLIVDDNVDAADALSDLLQLQGWETAVAYDGAHALRSACAVAPSIAILDLGLPGMDGCDLARQLRALPGMGAVHLVALTGRGEVGDRARTRQAGFAEHLVKPIDIDEIAHVIARVSASGLDSPPA